MVRVQRQGNETNVYSWDTRYDMWKREFTMVGDFDIKLANTDVQDSKPTSADFKYRCDSNGTPGQRNVYCYNCYRDQNCPFEGNNE